MKKKIDWNNINNLAKLAIDGDKLSYKSFLSSISIYLKIKISKSIPESFQEDTLQECLIAIHKSLHTLDTSKNCKPWVNAIAHYKVCDSLRMIYKKNNEFEYTEQASVKDHLSEIESNEILKKSLNQIKPYEKQIFLMAKHQGLSIKEISRKMNKTETNIKVIISRTIRKLREYISQEAFYE